MGKSLTSLCRQMDTKTERKEYKLHPDAGRMNTTWEKHQLNNMFWRKTKKKNKDIPTVVPANNQETTIIKATVLSDIGNIRSNNEDAMLILRNENKANGNNDEVLLIVADGMGGHQAGEVASHLAINIISREFFKQKKQAGIEKALQKAFSTANKHIYQKAATDKSLYGMGTTCTALFITENNVYYAHVGDSRAYLMKDSILIRITEDHTYVQQLLKMGEISKEEAASHPNRNILTNAMGTNAYVKVDTGIVHMAIVEADRLLLCSDGLHDYFNDTELADWLKSDKPLQQIAENMVFEAKRRGGHDNITLILAEKAVCRPATTLRNTADIDIHIT